MALSVASRSSDAGHAPSASAAGTEPLPPAAAPALTPTPGDAQGGTWHAGAEGQRAARRCDALSSRLAQLALLPLPPRAARAARRALLAEAARLAALVCAVAPDHLLRLGVALQAEVDRSGAEALRPRSHTRAALQFHARFFAAVAFAKGADRAAAADLIAGPLLVRHVEDTRGDGLVELGLAAPARAAGRRAAGDRPAAGCPLRPPTLPIASARRLAGTYARFAGPAMQAQRIERLSIREGAATAYSDAVLAELAWTVRDQQDAAMAQRIFLAMWLGVPEPQLARALALRPGGRLGGGQPLGSRTARGDDAASSC